MASKEQVQSFIKTLSALAQTEASSRKKSGKKWSLPSICIAQAALETGWGTSSLMTKANAYFGIKAGTSWTGKVYSSKTKECYDNVNYTTITDTFRAYNTLKESVADYFDLITGSSRYNAACCVTDATICITAIKNGGYATSPTYIQNVMSIVNTYNLTQYDSVIIDNVSTKNTNIKTNEEIAEEVISGKWGSGTARKESLTTAGYDYTTIQSLVNQMVKSTKTINYFTKYTGSSVSIVTALDAINATSSMAYRKKIAVKNSIVKNEAAYTGTSNQNTKMLQLLKQGILIKP